MLGILSAKLYNFMLASFIHTDNRQNEKSYLFLVFHDLDSIQRFTSFQKKERIDMLIMIPVLGHYYDFANNANQC